MFVYIGPKKPQCGLANYVYYTFLYWSTSQRIIASDCSFNFMCSVWLLNAMFLTFVEKKVVDNKILRQIFTFTSFTLLLLTVNFIYFLPLLKSSLILFATLWGHVVFAQLPSLSTDIICQQSKLVQGNQGSEDVKIYPINLTSLRYTSDLQNTNSTCTLKDVWVIGEGHCHSCWSLSR